MTLNGVIALILRFFPTEFDRFSDRFYQSGWRYTYNVRKILYFSSSLPLLAKTITHPAARSLCNSWASCLLFSVVLNIHSIHVDLKPVSISLKGITCRLGRAKQTKSQNATMAYTYLLVLSQGVETGEMAQVDAEWSFAGKHPPTRAMIRHLLNHCLLPPF